MDSLLNPAVIETLVWVTESKTNNQTSKVQHDSSINNELAFHSRLYWNINWQFICVRVWLCYVHLKAASCGKSTGKLCHCVPVCQQLLPMLSHASPTPQLKWAHNTKCFLILVLFVCFLSSWSWNFVIGTAPTFHLWVMDKWLLYAIQFWIWIMACSVCFLQREQ